MTPRANPDRVTMSASVAPETKAQLTERATVEDRIESALIRRALDVYLSLTPDEAETAVRRARFDGPAEVEG